jgi:hypothetical protein
MTKVVDTQPNNVCSLATLSLSMTTSLPPIPRKQKAQMTITAFRPLVSFFCMFLISNSTYIFSFLLGFDLQQRNDTWTMKWPQQDNRSAPTAAARGV